MTAHKHYEMIVAKAANMELVQFYKLPNENWWQAESDESDFPIESGVDYFLCLPQHKKACLHWLNGGESQINAYGWGVIPQYNGDAWSAESWFMDDKFKSRIKPRKEKRWIAVHKRSAKAEVFYKESIIDSCLAEPMYEGYQKFEIEIEV